MGFTTLTITDTNSTDYKTGCRYVVRRVDEVEKVVEATCENLSTWIFNKSGDYYYAKNESAGTYARGYIETFGDKKMKEFKAGDLVSPNDIKSLKNGQLVYTLNVDHSKPVIDLYRYDKEKDFLEDVVVNPKQSRAYEHETIYYIADNVSRVRLVGLFGDENVPDLPLRGSELTKRLLEKQKMQNGWFSSVSEADARERKNLDIFNRYDDDYGFVSVWGDEHGFVIPVDNNGNEITELPSARS